jgi:hypothetical protein
MADSKLDYSHIIKKCPAFDGVISQKAWEHIGNANLKTTDWLKQVWGGNIKKNIKSGLWKRHGSLRDGCLGIAKNKALIGVGAGQSFNKNKDVLQTIVNADGIKDWEDRDFVIAASNHMYKPLLKMGIIPDFVSLVDGSDVVMNQLTEDVPQEGQNTILLVGLHCSPKVLNKWTEQGREMRFYMPATEGLSAIFNDLTKENAEDYEVLQGGNVLNTLFSIGLRYLHATTFMALGNDLSYPLVEDMDRQRKSYYADGDYSSNAKGTGTGRDEATANKKWLGFNLEPALVGGHKITLDIVGTSPTLWVYKTWIESNVLLNAKGKMSYHYYNCSEAGIAGVMNKDMELRDEELSKEDNWYLLDDVCPRWHTTTLRSAAKQFLNAKEILWRRQAQEHKTAVQDVRDAITSGRRF